MSDQSPPPKPKVGSLRDRIAAFENKGAASSPQGPAAAPVPRPKPGGLQWKPKPPSPPPSPDRAQTVEKKVAGVGGMSASDAMESIGRGGTLKERMAALQGRGAFSGGAPPPMPPKPTEKPKWKPPPVVSPPADEDQKEFIASPGAREASRSPPPRAIASPTAEGQEAANPDGESAAQEGEGGEPDPEEEERQRRAAIAARMARLGGARVGMGPPIFAPKPVARKSEPPPPAPEAKGEEPQADQTNEADASAEALVASPPQDLPSSKSVREEAVAESEYFPVRKDSADSATTGPSRAPASMPVPVGPRRAAPPRKKAYKSAPTASVSEPPSEEPQTESPPLPNITDKALVLSAEQLSLSPPAESLTAGDAQPEVGEVNKSADASYDEHLDIKHEDKEPEPETTVSTQKEHETIDETKDLEADEESGEAASRDVEEESMHTAADDENAPANEAPEVEEEEDEEARRKRVAAKLAQMGAFNPFAGPPVPRRDSADDDEPKAEEEEEPIAEDVTNVDAEEVAESHPSLPVARKDTAESIKHVEAETHVETQEDNSKVDEGEEAPANRDDEPHPALTLGTEEESLAHIIYYHGAGGEVDEQDDGRTSPSPNLGEQRRRDEQSISEHGELAYAQQVPIEHTEEDQGGDFQEGDSGIERPGTSTGYSEVEIDAEEQIEQGRTHTDTENVVVPSTGFAREENEENEEESAGSANDDDDEMPPPRITRPIPPPPVNMASRPLPPSSPPLSPPPPPRTPMQTIMADEEDRAASPDIPPRPVPPPFRSVPDPASEGAPPAPPRRSMPPPPRRTSIKLAEPQAEAPPTPPPVPTSPRPMTRRPTTPPIITAISVQQEAEEPEEPEEESMAEQQVQSELAAPEPEVQEDEESVRRRTIAERMARLGGIRFGAPPMAPLSRGPMPSAPPPTSVPPDDSESEAKEEEQSRDEEEEEAARKQRIAAKLAGMGGMRFGMLPPPVGMPPAPVRRPIARQEDSESEDAALPVPVPAPAQRGPPVRRPPPPVQVPVEQEQASDDGVQVEAEESEIEEVHYSDADVPSASAEEEEAPPLPPPRRSPTALRSTEALPTPPPRMISRSPPPGRPPVPSIPATLLNRRPSVPTGSAPSSRKSSVDYSGSTETSTISYIPQRTRPTLDSVPSESGMRPQSEYVMVESEPEPEEAPAPPPRKSMRGPTRSVPLPPPPPPSAIDPPEELASSAQWELPSIPQGAEFGDSDLASSGWSEDSTAVHVPPPVISSPSSRRPSAQLAPSSGRRSIDQQQLTTDDLMTIWGKVGVQVVESATALFEKSKKSLVGDGSHAGFVRAVLAQVPGAQVAPGNEEWGYVVYAQTGSAVQRRVSEIMPGDVIAFWDAKLKGHKGLHAYSQTVGAGDGGALVGIVSEFEAKKSKVRIWQANQHVGQQTVESVSYRLEDLKNGHVKVFRVLEA